MLLTSPGAGPVLRVGLIHPLESRSHKARHLPPAFASGTGHAVALVALRLVRRVSGFWRPFRDWPGHSVICKVFDVARHIACPLCGRACLVYVHPLANANRDGERPFPRGRRPAQRAEPAADANPTVRQLRTGLGLTELGIRLRQQVGAELLYSATKISRIETGARRTSRATSGICARSTVWTIPRR